MDSIFLKRGRNHLKLHEELKSVIEDAEKRMPSDLPEHAQHDFHVYSWPQTWGSTSMGLGGQGCTMSVTAQTVVVMRYHHHEACVYFGGIFAYHVKNPSTSFFKFMRNFSMISRGNVRIMELGEKVFWE